MEMGAYPVILQYSKSLITKKMAGAKINTTTTYKVLHYQYLQGLYFRLPPEDNKRAHKHTIKITDKKEITYN